MNKCIFSKTCANKIHESNSCKLKASKYYGHKNAFVCPEHGLVQDMDFDAFVARHPADKCLVGFSTLKKVEVAQRIYVEKPIEAVVPQVPQIIASLPTNNCKLPDVPQVTLPVVSEAPHVNSNDAVASVLQTMMDMMVQQDTNTKSLKGKNMVEEYKVVKGSEGIIYAISSDDEAIVKEEKNPDDSQNDLILDLSIPSRKRILCQGEEKSKVRLRSPSFDSNYRKEESDLKSPIESGLNLSLKSSRDSMIKSPIEPETKSEIENDELSMLRCMRQTDIDAENISVKEEIRDIGFENLCPEKQYIPSRDILIVANMDKTLSKVERRYRRKNKEPAWKTGLSIKNRSPL